MNPFQKYVVSTEADVNINIDVNEAGTSDATAEAPVEVVDPVVAEEVAAEEALENQEEVVDVVTDGVASLESIYMTLAQVSQERDTLTDGEVAFMRIALAKIAKPMGGTAAHLVPSVESDNYFERNDVQVSMESVGSAIKAGGKAAYEAIKNLLAKLKEWFLNSSRKAKQKAAALGQLLKDAAFNGTYEIQYQSFNGANAIQSLAFFEKKLDGLLHSLDGRGEHDAAYKATDQLIIGNEVKMNTSRFEGRQAYELTKALERIYTKIASAKFVDKVNKAEREYESLATHMGDRTAEQHKNDLEHYQSLRQGYANIVASIDKFKITKHNGAPAMEK